MVKIAKYSTFNRLKSGFYSIQNSTDYVKIFNYRLVIIS